MKIKLIHWILFLALLTVTSMPLFSQGSEKIKPYIQLQYLKNTDDQRMLQTSLTYSKDRMELPLTGMEIAFYSGSASKKLVAKVVTDIKGIARLDLGNNMKLVSESDGKWAFSSEFTGNDTIEAGISGITVKDMKLELNLSVVDTIKTVAVRAFTFEGGREKPVTGEVVKVYVPRMFSLLPIGELTLDDSGTSSIEFPSDLPGDKEGNLVVIAKIEENEKFGNIEKKETVKWGLPTDYSVPVTHRALWTKIAPKWMIYSLSVLLAGVWGHYLFAIISLIRIKIDATRKAKEEYRV
jgi:hypothetical protein